MGSCCSSATEEDLANAQLEKNLQAEEIQESAVRKLLLLGAGQSGKSTLFKQMIVIYGKKYDEEKRKPFRLIIHSNILNSFRSLANNLKAYGGPVSQEIEESIPELLALEDDTELDEKLANQINDFWRHPGVQKAYSNRAKFQLTDNTKYLLDKVLTVWQKDFIPNQADILRSRVRTTGIVENEFCIDDNMFRMYDVGGQRNERKKWIHCFENVTAMLFVCAISAYDLKLFEDENINRMHESLEIFGKVVNSEWFTETSIMLFLNKWDLFQAKLKHTSIKVCFPSYDGPDWSEGCDEEEIEELNKEYVLEQFLLRNENPNKVVYPHVTTATDSRNVRIVFDAVKDIVIRGNLGSAGLV